MKFRSDLSVEPGIHWLVDSLPVEMLLPKPQATAWHLVWPQEQSLVVDKNVVSSGIYHDSQYHSDVLFLSPSKFLKENHVTLTEWSEVDLFFEENIFYS